MSPLTITESTAAALLFIILWHFAKRLFIKSPLSELPGPPSASFLSGNFQQMISRQSIPFQTQLAKEYGASVLLHGILQEEQLYTFDPLALEYIFVKDQHIYEETDVFIAQNNLVFGCGLLSTLGEHHRKQRKMLNPVFAPKHMRELIPIFYPIAHRLRDVLTSQVRTHGEEDINVMKWMSRAALEYIGQGGLGYSFDTLDETKVNTYSEVLKMLGPASFGTRYYRQAIPFLVKLGPAWFRRAVVNIFPSKAVHAMRDVVDAMDAKSHEIFVKKKEALKKGDEAVVNQVGKGKDIMSVLLKANMHADGSEKLPDAELIGQMNTFIFAGHDTTTSAISRTLHVLTEYPEIQDKLRKEVTEARAQYGDLDYDMLMGLPYLDAVCREILRVYPPVSALIRTTRDNCVLPLLWPVKSADGRREINSVPLKKGTKVITSIINSNRSTRVWGPDAGDFRPERWLSPLPESVAKAHLPGVYASMMTFIGGGRACIGFKFAEMEMKLVLSILLEKFVFSPGSQEIIWNSGGIQSPTVKGSNDVTPRLPMKVAFA